MNPKTNNMTFLFSDEGKTPSQFSDEFEKETGGRFKLLISHSATRDDGSFLYWDTMMPNGKYMLVFSAESKLFSLWGE